MAAPKRNTTQRGYGVKHQRARKAWEPRVNAGGVSCARCGRGIEPGSAWDLGHTADRSGYTGPEHMRCNRSEGARRGNAMRRNIPPSRAW